MIPFLHKLSFITARKRSLRRLCFYRCLWLHAWLLRGGHAWLLLGEHAWLLPGGHAWLFLGEVRGCSQGGVHGCSWGGMHGCSGGHVWLLRGACMVALGGCVVALGGMHCCSSGHALLFPGGMCGCSGGGERVWDTTRYGDTINERAVSILLECILVCYSFHSISYFSFAEISCLLLLFSVRILTTFPPTPGRQSTPPSRTSFPPTTTPKQPIFVTDNNGQLVTNQFSQPVTYFQTDKPSVGPASGEEDDGLALSKGKQQLR